MITEEINRFKAYITSVVPMDDDTFNLSVPFLKVISIDKGQHFVNAGIVCKQIAYIDKGIFRIYHLKDGVEVNTCFCIENSITSAFSSFASGTESEQSIQALENCVIVSLSKENLLNLYKSSPIWQSVGMLMTEKECLRLSNRASSLSFETALEKYKNILQFQPELIRRVSLQNIASYIGVSRETLSRIRKKIASE